MITTFFNPEPLGKFSGMIYESKWICYLDELIPKCGFSPPGIYLSSIGIITEMLFSFVLLLNLINFILLSSLFIHLNKIL